jgi:LuxR family maltose regulon positive regulatory protein
MLSAIPVLRSHLAVLRGEVARALALAQESIELTPKDALLSEAHAYGALAIALEAKPDSAGAIAAMEAAIAVFRKVRNSLSVAVYTYHLARLLIRRGELSRAETACREVLRLAEEAGLGTLPPYRLVYTALALVFIARGDADAAERELRLGLELDRGGSGFEEEKDTFLTLARLQLLRGNVEGALETLEEAAEVVLRSGAQLGAGEVEARHAVVLLRSGDLEGAGRWAERATARGGDDRGYLREAETFARARVLIAERREAEALELLDSLLAEAERDGRVGSQTDALVIRALAQRARGRVEQALGDLWRALALAEPEGHAQPFLDEGEALAELLRRGAAEHRWSAPLDEFVARLLGALSSSARRPARDIALPTLPAARPEPPTQPQIEPLSERELEVLALMAEGLTNERIASRLIIAVGTVKAHIHNIAGKLATQNRAQAVAKAKELGLL